MTFNNIVSGDTVFIGSREDINHLSPETEDNSTADQSHPLLSVSVILAPYHHIYIFLKISKGLAKGRHLGKIDF